MIDDVKVQLFLRNILLDFLDTVVKDGMWLYEITGTIQPVPLLFVSDNTQGHSIKDGIIIEEHFSSESASNYLDFSENTCYYHLKISDDRGTGLRLKRFVNLIKDFFSVGVYHIDDNTGLEILDVHSASYTTEEDDTKVAIILSVSCHVFALT